MSRRGTYEFTADKAWGDAPEVADSAVSTVLLVGDIHGEKEHLDNAIACAVHCEAQAIVQLGDFWLADRHWQRFKRTESHYMEAAAASPVPIIVIDGNHEVWPSLARFAITRGATDARAARRPVNLGGSLWWAWRGSVWTWGERAMGALGGAVSRDKHLFELRRHRWPRYEGTTQEDVDQLLANVGAGLDGWLDVLFTHDAPTSACGLQSDDRGVPPETVREMDANRDLLEMAVQGTHPEYLVHGHWHQNNRERINDRTEAVGITYNGRWGHHAVLTTQPKLGIETWEYPTAGHPHGRIPAGLEPLPGVGIVGATAVRTARRLDDRP